MGLISISEKIRNRLQNIYTGHVPDNIIEDLAKNVERIKSLISSVTEKWNEKDIILITYGDSIIQKGKKPLSVLKNFLDNYLSNTINYVHILPFFPYSSDDGFSVIDYYRVNPQLGNWNDIDHISKDYNLMADLVINHISQHSEWFQNYLKGENPGEEYFIEVDTDTDLSKVIRPRSLPLLTKVKTKNGEKYVWTTFSSDQIDLNFSNPRLLKEMIDVLLFYLSKRVRIIRLDAIAFLWKEIGTNCLHLPQTHEIVKLMRDIVDYIDPEIILITETNVPNKENLSYFGNGDEANMVYQFSLPPLLLHALYSANSKYLTSWAESLSEIPEGCTFFNFTASHDGIGVRPLEGILPASEVLDLAVAMKNNGGFVSTKRNSDGTDSPYELNITYFDALKKTVDGKDNFHAERFICSQTLMMSFKGIPAFYIHSLLATENYIDGVKKTGMFRTINRKKLIANVIAQELKNNPVKSYVFSELKKRINIRKSIHAFHPESNQQVINIGDKMFCLIRGNKNELTVIANLSSKEQIIPKDRVKISAKAIERISVRIITHPLKLKPYQVMWIEQA